MSNTIFRRRGDTYPVQVTITNAAGVPQDIGGKAFVLTVSEEENPVNTTAQLFQLIGTVTDAANGEVEFPMTGEQADNLGRFFFDVEMSDAVPEVFEWTPPTAPADGDPASIDGSEHWFIFDDALPSITYETRDGRRVMRHGHPSTGGYDSTGWVPKQGSQFSRQEFYDVGWEWQVTAYLNRGLLSFEMQGGLYWNTVYLALDTRTGTPAVVDGGGFTTEALGYWTPLSGYTPPDPAAWGESGWFVLGLRLDTDGKAYMQLRPEADPDDWLLVHPGIWHPAILPIKAPNLWTRREYPDNPASLVDVWKYEWRQLL